MRRKILLVTSIGTRGDVYPFISLGVSLKKCGYEVIMLSGEIYAPLIAKTGLDFIPYYDAEDSFKNANSPEACSSDLKKMLQFLIDHQLPKTMRHLYGILSQFDPKDTLIAASSDVIGAKIAHEKLNIPLVTICLQPAALWSLEKPITFPNGTSLKIFPLFFRKVLELMMIHFYLGQQFLPLVNAFRHELGLANIENITRWRYSSQKVIGLFPEWFAPRASDWPKNVELVGFVGYSELLKSDIPEDVVAFLASGSPPIIITYGTGMLHGNHFFRTSLEAARSLGFRCLLLTPSPEQLPALDPNNEMHVHYISLDKILNQCAAIIHHGGIGTLSQALAARVPQLVVPYFVDQPDNAARLKKLGLCVTIPINKYSMVRATSGLKKLLASTKIKERTHSFSKKIAFSQAEQKICQTIDELDSKLNE